MIEQIALLAENGSAQTPKSRCAKAKNYFISSSGFCTSLDIRALSFDIVQSSHMRAVIAGEGQLELNAERRLVELMGFEPTTF